MIDFLLLLAVTGSVVVGARLMYPERIRWTRDGADRSESGPPGRDPR